MCVIQTLKCPKEPKLFKMLQGEGGKHHTFEVSMAYCSYHNSFWSLTQKTHLVAKSYRYPGAWCVLRVREERSLTPAHGLRTSKLMSLEVVLSDNSGYHHAVLPHHTCGSVSTLSCCPRNQNILQNPHIAEVLPNNRINQGQRWTSHVTLSASKLTQNYNNPSPPEKLILCIPHVSHVRPSLHQSGNTTSNNQ